MSEFLDPTESARKLEELVGPRSRYYGEFSPQRLLLNANLQEFAHKVDLLVALETGGKISTQEAYTQIRFLWKQLKQTYKSLSDPTDDSPSGEDEE